MIKLGKYAPGHFGSSHNDDFGYIRVKWKPKESGLDNLQFIFEEVGFFAKNGKESLYFGNFEVEDQRKYCGEFRKIHNLFLLDNGIQAIRGEINFRDVDYRGVEFLGIDSIELVDSPGKYIDYLVGKVDGVKRSDFLVSKVLKL